MKSPTFKYHHAKDRRKTKDSKYVCLFFFNNFWMWNTISLETLNNSTLRSMITFLLQTRTFISNWKPSKILPLVMKSPTFKYHQVNERRKTKDSKYVCFFFNDFWMWNTIRLETLNNSSLRSMMTFFASDNTFISNTDWERQYNSSPWRDTNLK